MHDEKTNAKMNMANLLMNLMIVEVSGICVYLTSLNVNYCPNLYLRNSQVLGTGRLEFSFSALVFSLSSLVTYCLR
jgi:hypothetical protein